MASPVATAGRWIGIVMMFTGLALLGWGCSTVGGTASAWLTGESAQGRVVEIKSRQHRHAGRTRYTEFAVVAFTAADGKVFHVEDRVGATRSAYKVGERVKVWYRGDAPQEAILAASSPWSLGGGAMLSAFGAVSVVLGALVMLVARLPWKVDRSAA